MTRALRLIVGSALLAGCASPDNGAPQRSTDVFTAPPVELPQPLLSVDPYGRAINNGQPDLVRFVNGVLERMRADNTPADLEAKWLGGTVDPLPPIPDASSRD